MQPLKTYVDEFIAIAAFCLQNPDAQKKKGFLVVPKEQIEVLLDQNKYDTSHNKLQIWKQLHWIDAEENRLTKRVFDKEAGKQIHRIKLDLSVYQMLEEWNEK